jgi:hypothetical protein
LLQRATFLFLTIDRRSFKSLKNYAPCPTPPFPKLYIIAIILTYITRTIDTPSLFDQFYTAILQPHTLGDSTLSVGTTRSAASAFCCLHRLKTFLSTRSIINAAEF